MLGSVSADCVRILKDFQVYSSPPTSGRDSNSLLEDVFGVEVRSNFALEALNTVAKLIDDDAFADASAKLDDLKSRLTDTDPEVARLRDLLSFMAS